MSIAPPSGTTLSVVVAASHSAAGLEACLASLREQVAGGATEVIAVCNYRGDPDHAMKLRFPFTQFVVVPPTTTVPQLRALGVRASSGEVVALLEDNVTVASTWCRAITTAHDGSQAIVGGPIERVGSHRAVDWAVYFYEYGKYMLPMPEGKLTSLPGNNVSYTRALLDAVQHEWQDGLFEAFLNERLQGQGCVLRLVPNAVAYHTMRYQAREVLVQCYHHGRHFAGRRVAGAALVTRLGFAAASMLLPLILPLRIAARALRKRRHVGALAIALPYLSVFMTSWACGECVGYLFGEGESVNQWV